MGIGTSTISPRRIGIVGASRTRQGLGPFLAGALASAGCRIAAVSGRSPDGAARAAGELAAKLGYPVGVASSPLELARQVDALVIAAPVAAHLGGMQAALTAGIPCLCEKPLVDPLDIEAALRLVTAFDRSGLLLVENCQWPYVLPALHTLYPHLVGRPIRRVAMGLGPGWPGPAMVADSLSHVLSVVQALVPMAESALPSNVRQTDAGPFATHNVLTFEVPGPANAVEVSLELVHQPQQPRKAWIEVDGCRIDRRLGPDYSHTFVADTGESLLVRDPLHQLVYGFAALLQAPNRERTHAIASDIRLRLRLYAAVFADLG
ncbi:MAG: Gfo/Idh/MocA family oxidoreductase [Planctomycetes bacterium]|nr:Gfo/Idh/MocA family oxidoreductase [Planctomycetota bacterium]